MKTINKKLRNNGFSLSETLITVLLMSIILSGVIGGIIACRNSYEKVVQRADALTLLATISESMEADLSSASEPVFEYTDNTKTVIKKDDQDNEIISFTSGIRKYSMSFVNDEGSICIDTPDVANPFGVTTKGEHTKKLRSKLTNLHYDDSNNCFTYTIVIETNETTPKEILSQYYVVRRYS